jgi:hypothetical protein
MKAQSLSCRAVFLFSSALNWDPCEYSRITGRVITATEIGAGQAGGGNEDG